jgi:hypothetical protein
MCGLANVLQCAVALSRWHFSFSFQSRKKLSFETIFSLAHNGCGYET